MHNVGVGLVIALALVAAALIAVTQTRCFDPTTQIEAAAAKQGQ